jgi:hypothetical protein
MGPEAVGSTRWFGLPSESGSEALNVLNDGTMLLLPVAGVCTTDITVCQKVPYVVLEFKTRKMAPD